MARIDSEALIANVDVPPSTGEWLDLFGDAIVATQNAGLPHEATHVADTPYKRFMVHSVNRDLEAMVAIHLLLRCRFTHQAAAQTRLLCEGLITWRFIAQEPDRRARQFEEYSIIELHRIAEAIVQSETSHAKPNPTHVAQVRALLDESKARFAKAGLSPD